MKFLSLLACSLLLIAFAAAAELPAGYWPLERTQPILDARLKVTLDPDLGHLSPAESQALGELLEAGQIMHAL
ncbi:MAG: NUDIX hydrolase, partial [Gammaproteobacteria bacterium]|nr:NUDIX hydrolase [Gammaproteobacteria bacterium]